MHINTSDWQVNLQEWHVRECQSRRASVTSRHVNSRYQQWCIVKETNDASSLTAATTLTGCTAAWRCPRSRRRLMRSELDSISLEHTTHNNPHVHATFVGLNQINATEKFSFLNCIHTRDVRPSSELRIARDRALCLESRETELGA